MSEESICPLQTEQTHIHHHVPNTNFDSILQSLGEQQYLLMFIIIILVMVAFKYFMDTSLTRRFRKSRSRRSAAQPNITININITNDKLDKFDVGTPAASPSVSKAKKVLRKRATGVAKPGIPKKVNACVECVASDLKQNLKESLTTKDKLSVFPELHLVPQNDEIEKNKESFELAEVCTKNLDESSCDKDVPKIEETDEGRSLKPVDSKTIIKKKLNMSSEKIETAADMLINLDEEMNHIEIDNIDQSVS